MVTPSLRSRNPFTFQLSGEREVRTPRAAQKGHHEGRPAGRQGRQPNHEGRQAWETRRQRPRREIMKGDKLGDKRAPPPVAWVEEQQLASEQKQAMLVR